MKKKRQVLIKKGTPLPGKKSFVFDSSHLTELAAKNRSDNLFKNNPKLREVKVVRIPRQIALYPRKVRITPKRGRIR